MGGPQQPQTCEAGTKVCARPGCGVEFSPGDRGKRTTQLYCSPKCRIRACADRYTVRHPDEAAKRYRASLSLLSRDEIRAKWRANYYRNRAKNLAGSRARRAANPELYRAKKREYARKHIDKYRAYRDSHRDHLNKKKRQLRAANPDRFRAYRVAYRARHKHRLLEVERNKARSQRGFLIWLRTVTLNLTFSQTLEGTMAKKATETEAFRKSLKAIDTAKLIKQFGENVKTLEDFWEKNAYRLYELESRGITEAAIIEELAKGNITSTRWKQLFKIFRDITDGRHDPQFISRFAADPGVLIYGKAQSIEVQREMLTMTPAEINKLTRSKQAEAKPRRPEEKARPNLIAIAAEASARDLIDMVLEMVEASKNPAQVANGLMAKLAKVASRQPAKRRAG